MLFIMLHRLKEKPPEITAIDVEKLLNGISHLFIISILSKLGEF